MIKILVTAVGNLSIGGQIVRSIRKSNISCKIYGTDVVDYCIPYNLLDSFYTVSPPTDFSAYFKQIKQIVEKEVIDILFIGSGGEIEYYFLYAEAFESLRCKIVSNNLQLFKLCLNKNLLYTELKKEGIEIPKFQIIEKREDICKIDFFPVVLKPNTHANGSQSVFIAFDFEDLNLLATYLMKNNIDIIAQEYVGDKFSEITLSVNSTDDGEVMGIIILKRVFASSISYKSKIVHNNKDYYISSGITQGEFIHNENIVSQALKIVKALKSQGPLNIQAMYVNGKLLVIEIHPIITGSVFIKTLAGYNEPEQYIEYKMNNVIKLFDYKDCKVIRYLENEIIKEK